MSCDHEEQINSLIFQIKDLELRLADAEEERDAFGVLCGRFNALFESSLDNAERVARGLTAALKFEVYTHEAFAVLEEFRRRLGLPPKEAPGV